MQDLQDVVVSSLSGDVQGGHEAGTQQTGRYDQARGGNNLTLYTRRDSPGSSLGHNNTSTTTSVTHQIHITTKFLEGFVS